MAKAELDKRVRQAIQDARNLVLAIERQDANEAETRRRIERVFENVMGYDAFAHLSRERAVHGAGETEHVDFAIQIEEGPDAPPVIMVEIKRVGVDLTGKHLRQAAGYAIDAGCDWVLLTNARDWQLYHVEFGKPPVTKLVEQWNLLSDEVETVAAKFGMVGYRSVKRGTLKRLWERAEALAPQGLLTAILAPETLTTIRRLLRRETGVAVKPDHIVTALRKMLNEASATMLEDVNVSLPDAAAQRKARPGGKRVGLSDVVQAGMLSAGTVLFNDYKGVHYEATVQADGSVIFEGKSYKTLSAAGGIATAKHNVSAPNGWLFWKFKDASGGVQALDELRQKCQAQSGASDQRQG